MSLNFKTWLESGVKGVISFDFDSTLTKPIWSKEDELWQTSDNPHSENHDLMRKYASQGYSVIIVTSRNQLEKRAVEEFVRKHQLPVNEIYCTNGEKGSTLARLGVLVHHDDMPQNFEDPKRLFEGSWVRIKHPMDGY